MTHLRTDLDRAKRNIQDIQKARNISRNLGIKSAIGFLQNRQWSAEAAVYILYGPTARE